MKYISVFLLMISAFVCQAQQLQLKYSKTTDPFKWTVSNIEFKQNQTFLTVKVKNTAYDTRFISFSQGEYIYSEKFPRGIKATDNSYRFNSVAKNVSLRHNDEISFVLTFPSSQIGNGKTFNLRIGTHFKLNEIPIPELTLSYVNKQMLTWEQFYSERRKVRLTYQNVTEVKTAIKNEVEKWQRKGEFESTIDWKARVNDQTRQQYVTYITSKLSAQHESELNKIRSEQVRLAEDYEKYKESILEGYYQHKISHALNIFNSSNFELQPYDADNQTFLIHSDLYGDILLPVPIGEAPSFKNNWFKISANIKPYFVPSGEDVALNKLLFSNNGKQYVFDRHTVANYAITDVNYNFAPIEIAEINFNDIKIDGKPSNPTKVSSSVVAINNSNVVISKARVTPTVKHISASDKSDIDTAIPCNAEMKNSTTFAVIIANEKYNNVSNVSYAENDGYILSKYLVNTVGIPSDHVKIYSNATYGNMAGALKHIKNLSLAFGDKLNLIFYYAGHGVPNEQTKQCMLLPIDGDAIIPETCYDVNKLYSDLGNLNANSVIVIMDACFSGSLRGDGMLYASRSVKIKSNHAEPKGNMVILSASQGDETAFPFDKEQHGLFTYYILKCLQENKGNITLGNLSEYLIEQVKRQSVVTNGKIQTPMVQFSNDIKDSWSSWKLAQ